ncbi:MAG: endonuclease/exonuclease/phosphatase family protein [Pirellulales bacterium]|nr:endonuclease/exonuclease/phosphatase family protein [Pirellulales bacterium]
MSGSFARWLVVWLVLVSLAVGSRVSLAAEDGKPFDLNIVTFNILVELSTPDGVGPWKDRKDLCVDLLREKNPDLIGFQEPTPRQVKDLQAALPEYGAVFYDAKKPGYTDATLFYKRDLFEVVDRGHWWLSPTPDRVSVGFGNALPRILVWARLKHLPTGRELYAFNTHFDNSSPCQERMAELCEKQFVPFLEQNLPMFFFGDFNTSQKRGDYPRLTSNGWRDSYLVSDIASDDGRDDNITTMFDGNIRIDHIFYHGEGIEPLTWQRLESPDPARPLSDHYPVQATFRVK